MMVAAVGVADVHMPHADIRGLLCTYVQLYIRASARLDSRTHMHRQLPAAGAGASSPRAAL